MSSVIENTYWNHKGKQQAALNALQQLVPSSGTVQEPRKNRALEKFRKASNCYYDLYNNGLCNRRGEFRRIYGFASTDYAYGRGNMRYADTMYVKTEAKINEFIEAAVREQGLEHLLTEE